MGYNERYIENKLVSRSKKLGGRAFKWVSPGCTGVPDRIVILPGPRILFVELKRPGRKASVSQRQEKLLKWFRGLGCEAYCVSEEDEIDKLLERNNGV